MLPVTPNTIAFKSFGTGSPPPYGQSLALCGGVLGASCYASAGFMPWMTFSSIGAMAVQPGT